MSLIRDEIRPALRVLARRPALAVTSIVTLALGVGAATALFAVVWGVLLRPLPWPEADRLVQLSEIHPGGQGQIRAPLLSDLTARPWAWEGTPRTIEGIGIWSRSTATVRQGGELERLPSASFSPIVFDLLRARPAAGRLFLPEDAQPQAAPVVVLSAGFWRDRFASSGDVLGQTLEIDGKAHLVVGVAAEGFGFPDREPRLYLPYPVPLGGEGSITVFGALARLKPGVTLAQAEAEGTGAARSVERPMVADLLFGKGGPVQVRATRYLDQLTASVRPALWVLSVAVALLLLVASANVANLLLSHGISRQRELAVRAALGAGRRRLLRQVLTESLLLSLAGGGLGLLLAAIVVGVLPSLAPSGFPRLDDVRLDGGIAAFALLLAIGSGLLAGLVPALRVSADQLVGRLRDGDKGATGGRGLRLRNGLLVLEAALCLVLLVGAALLGRSFASLLAVDAGYDPQNVLAVRLVQADGNDEEGIEPSAVTALLERLRGLPGVAAAGAGNMMPFSRNTAIAAAGLPWTGADGQPVVARARFYRVTPGYAEALGLRRRDGRLLAAGDEAASPRPFLVNEDFVRSFLPADRKAVGLQLTGAFGEEGMVSEIVGVIGNVLKEGLDAEARPEVYFVAGGDARWSTELDLAVRASGDPGALGSSLRQLVREVDPRLVVDALTTLETQVAESVSKPRFATTILVVFSAVALALAAIGLYGALSYAVSLRRRELGVRAALGAERSDLLRLVLRQGLGVTAAGVAVGLVAAAASTRLMASLLFGVTAWDAVAFTTAPLLLLLVATIASLVPARRAAASDPAVVLRGE
ncbi:MAG TPA: ADOP family duplicated permease [Thermoanaerobaculia bacterium]|nr:ADOP family duplicated permease [Thermoanaerobaculia bacterium]